MKPANLNIYLYKGQTWRKQLTFKVNKEPLDLTGLTFTSHIRPEENSDTLTAEMTVETFPEEGIVCLILPATVTGGLGPDTLVWDLKSIDEEDLVDYWVRGNVFIGGRVTV